MFSVILIGITLAFNLPFATTIPEKPVLPYNDIGACPFECCNYGNWSATSETDLRADHDDSSPVVASVKAGEDVQGLTGVVITSRSGKVKILRETAFNVENSREEFMLRPGDLIYPLRYVGEGFDKFYFEGYFLIGRTNITRVGKFDSWEVIDLPQWNWWAKIRRQNGETGWTRELDHFDHIDACE